MAHVPTRTSRYFPGGIAQARSVLRERPVAYDPDLFDTILEMISCGESLNEICSDRDAPLPSTFYKWIKEDNRLDDRYREALAMHADVSFDEATSQAFDSDAIRGGLRHRAMLVRAERMLPEKYGPRATIRNTKEVEDESGGIDYAGEVRRRLEGMADRMRQSAASAAEDTGL